MKLIRYVSLNQIFFKLVISNVLWIGILNQILYKKQRLNYRCFFLFSVCMLLGSAASLILYNPRVCSLSRTLRWCSVPCNSKNLHVTCPLYGPMRLTSQFSPSGYTWASVHLFCVGECVFICCGTFTIVTYRENMESMCVFWSRLFSNLGAYKAFQRNTKTSHLRFAVFIYTSIQKFGVGKIFFNVFKRLHLFD